MHVAATSMAENLMMFVQLAASKSVCESTLNDLDFGNSTGGQPRTSAITVNAAMSACARCTSEGPGSFLDDPGSK